VAPTHLSSYSLSPTASATPWRPLHPVSPAWPCHLCPIPSVAGGRRGAQALQTDRQTACQPPLLSLTQGRWVLSVCLSFLISNQSLNISLRIPIPGRTQLLHSFDPHSIPILGCVVDSIVTSRKKYPSPPLVPVSGTLLGKGSLCRCKVNDLKVSLS
jgi:hypothetical protein